MITESGIIIPERKNVVTLCRGGQVRSVGLKYLLTYKYGHDAIPCGHESNSDATREMLFKWADYIVVMQEYMREYVPEEYHKKPDGSPKLFCYDVGEDTYGYAFHPKLIEKLDNIIQQHGLFL